MVAPARWSNGKPRVNGKKVRRKYEDADAPRPTLPKIIQCAACGYDLPAEQHPRNDRLFLIDRCPKCHGFHWELIEERTVPIVVKTAAFVPCPGCGANRAGIAGHEGCATCGLSLREIRSGRYE